jgi:hypothetical protein
VVETDRQPRAFAQLRRTRRISCEAVPPFARPAGAQGGTLSRRSGAALSFVSCIRLLDRATHSSKELPKLLDRQAGIRGRR